MCFLRLGVRVYIGAREGHGAADGGVVATGHGMVDGSVCGAHGVEADVREQREVRAKPEATGAGRGSARARGRVRGRRPCRGWHPCPARARLGPVDAGRP